MAERYLDRRQVLRAALLAAAGVVVPAACGVPSGGGPIVDGAGPSYDPVIGAKGRPPEPGNATSATNLVELFLYAASGPLESIEQFNAARDRARRFLTKAAADAWRSSVTDEFVTVVRVAGLTPSISGVDTIVSGTLQPVGSLLGKRGEVDRYTGDQRPARVDFTVTPGPDGPRISDLPDGLPPGLLLASDALDNKYFTPQVIYFWDNAKRGLVPDLRYVPNTDLVDSARLAAVVNWLLAEPSELISPVALRAAGIFPTGTTLLGPYVVIQGDRVVINFSSALQGLPPPALAEVLAQLRWSLQPLHRLTSGPVELQIASRPQQLGNAGDLYRSVNPADEVTRAAEPQPFYVVGNAVDALDGQLPAVLAKPEYNRSVERAALSRDKRAAALLTVDHRLLLGRVDETGTVSYLAVDQRGTAWSRPAWLPSGQRLLVVVDGRLLAVTAAGAVSRVLVPDAGAVTAFAVAPDGYRIALIDGGRVRVGALSDERGQPVVSPNLRLLDTGLLEPSAVAWSRLDRLVVAGRSETDQWVLAEITIDGAVLTLWNTSFANRIASVVAYPKLPSQPPGPGLVMVETGDRKAYRVFPNPSSATSQPLTARDTGPSASASPGKPRPDPTAPFYPD